jgi:integrase
MSTEKDFQHILALLEMAGIDPDELADYANRGDAGTGNTIKWYVDEVLAGLTRNTARSYRTHYLHLINGIERQCDCDCLTCIEEFRKYLTCKCQCRTCKNAVDFPAMGDVIATRGSISQINLELLVQTVRKMASKKAKADNVTRARQGLAPKPTHGQGAQEMCVTALSALFARLVRDGVLSKNLADDLPRGHRSATKRRSLTDQELVSLFNTVVSGGDDPELDLALTWAEFELGARRNGIVSLSIGQLDFETQMVTLHEKGNREDQQPCTLELMTFLSELAVERAGDICRPGSSSYNPNARVLYYKDSTPKNLHPITSRRFDTLHKRIQQSLPWANSISYSGHALRHTIGTMVERMAGYEVAKRMLRHAGTSQTDTYVKAGPVEVAKAISNITGRDHPLAD